MPTASQRVLLNFFSSDLHFTPTPTQVECFERDLALVSPSLMGAALKEAAANDGLINKRFEDRRAAIFGIYYRKVAEHGQLFPVFHTFETAFRSLVAVELETLYKGRAAWWTPIRDALLAGNDAKSVPHIYGVPISKDAAHQIGQIIMAIEGPALSRSLLKDVEDGYAFAELCDLAHIQSLIIKHWKHFSKVFVKNVTVDDFRGKFTSVRKARNDIYHHKSLAKMSSVVTSAEELLSYIHCSLSFSYTKITESRVVKPGFALPVVDQGNVF